MFSTLQKLHYIPISISFSPYIRYMENVLLVPSYFLVISNHSYLSSSFGTSFLFNHNFSTSLLLLTCMTLHRRNLIHRQLMQKSSYSTYVTKATFLSQLRCNSKAHFRLRSLQLSHKSWLGVPSLFFSHTRSQTTQKQ